MQRLVALKEVRIVYCLFSVSSCCSSQNVGFWAVGINFFIFGYILRRWRAKVGIEGYKCFTAFHKSRSKRRNWTTIGWSHFTFFVASYSFFVPSSTDINAWTEDQFSNNLYFENFRKCAWIWFWLWFHRLSTRATFGAFQDSLVGYVQKCCHRYAGGPRGRKDS